MGAALVAGTAASIAACSSPDSTSPASDAGGSDGGAAKDSAEVLSGVTVSGEVGQEPSIALSAPLSFTGSHSALVSSGSGTVVTEDSTIITRSAFFDPSTGDLLASQWASSAFGVFQVNAETIGPEAATFFVDKTAGSRFLMAGEAGGQQVIQVGDIDGVALQRADGTAEPLPPELPSFTLGEDGSPTLDAPPTGPAPTAQITALAQRGSGREAAVGDTLVMHYRGWTWEGEEFDSSWGRGTPFSFVLGQGQVIEGWDSGLVGVAAGSQVVLALPPAVAYGNEGESTSELAGKTLLFVADVLYVASPSALEVQ